MTMKTQHSASANGQSATSAAYPAPAPLATPTDLTPKEAGSVVEAINPLVADAFALYMKTKNYHWHVSGPHFRDYHLLFEEQADSLLAATDPLAERVRKLGGTTLHSIGQICRLQSVPDDDEAFVPPDEMVRRLLADNRHLAERQRAAIALCEASRDTPTSDLLQEVLNETERRIWFLFELNQTQERTP